MVVEAKGFGEPFAFVITGTDTDGVDAAFVGLGLGVDFRVAIDLGGGGLEDTGFNPFAEAKGVHHAQDGGLGGLDGVVLVERRGGGTGEIVDLIDFEFVRIADVVTDEFEVGMIDEGGEVAFPAGVEVIKADDFVVFIQKALAEVRPEEPGTAGD